ncbi:hypothetical protein GDO86_004271 [Hymenochirus boettgeri]|uniref:Uncharacterized protein n=1 Tax=Hymenochirus boettgeri TaxID=247094 RepID=A0A8T2K956_9PIPI|nr:hypothetical protein GDO86_004271 [Hymenochirus boettgeri]
MSLYGCDTGFGNLLAKRLSRKGFHVLAGCLTQAGTENLQKDCPVNLKSILLDLPIVKVLTKQWNGQRQSERPQGRIVNMASVLGRISANGGGYCVSKYAVEAFSDSLRRDIAALWVRVCIIEPGFFRTAVTDLDSIERSLQKLWDQMLPESKMTYGEEYFQQYLKVQRLIMNFICDPDISKFPMCIEHALQAQYPRTRYSPGWDAKFLWLPVSYMPSFVVDAVLGFVLPKPHYRVH